MTDAKKPNLIDVEVIKPFRRAKPGDRLSLTRRQAKVMIAARKVRYFTRDMKAAALQAAEPETYDTKDARKKPGRKPKAPTAATENPAAPEKRKYTRRAKKTEIEPTHPGESVRDEA